MNNPKPLEAAEMVATADRLRRAVRDESSWRYVCWLAAMAPTTLLYLVGLAVVRTDTDALVISGVFGACVFGLAVALLPGVRVNKAGFPRRWVTAMVAWGIAFAVTMVLGLLLFRGELAFWLPAAVITALPLALGARAEARA